MQDKKKPIQSIDGFIARPSNATRRIGFDVGPAPRAARKPLAAPQAVPRVGQTLASYSPSALNGGVGMSQARPQVGRTAASFTLLDDETPQRRGKQRGRARNRNRAKAAKADKTGWRRYIGWKRVLASFLIVLLLLGGWIGFKAAYNLAKTFHGGLFSVLGSTHLKGEDVGRVNILLAGNSSDDAGHNGGRLTDSIMIISLDTKNKTAFMMSVPRDLYVEIPGYGHAKINEAYVDGEDGNFKEDGYFPGGMGLLQQTIQNSFDINLDYYSLIDYNALKQMVDAVGGIDLTVKSTDPRGLYDPSIDYVTHGPLVKLTNGTHHLNGEQALDLSRARGDAYGSYGFPAADFDRTNNQRQELLALKTKVVSAGTLANPAKLSSLFDALGSNVKTDFTLGEVRRAYDLMKNVNNIQSVGLNNLGGKNLLTSYATPTGQSALIPAAGLDDFSDIQAAMKQLTSTNPVTREGANVAVLNATETNGVAAANAKLLKTKGVIVASTGDANPTQATTAIVDNSGGKFPATKKLLQHLYGTAVVTNATYTGYYPDADFIIMIGSDHQTPPTSSSANSSRQ